MIVTITVPLTSIPGVEIGLRTDYEYQSPVIVPVSLDRLSLQFEGEVEEDWTDGNGEGSVTWNDKVTPSGGNYKLSKPRLVIA